MSAKFLLIFLASFALWSLSQSLVIKEQELVTDVEQSTVDSLNITFNSEDASSTALSTEEDENLPVQTIEDEKNDTSTVIHNDSDLHTQKDEEQLLTSASYINNMIESVTELDKNIEIMNVTVESHESDAKNEEDEQKECTITDQEKTNLSTVKPEQQNEVETAEQEETITHDDGHDRID